MASEFTITSALASDLDALVRLLGVLFSIEKDFRPEPARQRAGLTLLLADPERCGVFVARDPLGAVGGMVTAQVVISTAQGGPSVWLEDLVIDAAWRGRGLGKALLAHAATWARSRQATRVQLVVDTENAPAVEFYERLGWDTTQLQVRRKSL